MRSTIPFCVFLSLAVVPLYAQETVPSRPASPPVEPVVEDYFGNSITDDYRYMETKGDPVFHNWIRDEGAYTRAVFDTLKRSEAMRRIAKFTGSFGFTTSFSRYGGRSFWLERAPGSDNYDLMVSDDVGARKLIDVAALRANRGGVPMAINYFGASPDGAKVAVGISEGGSELAGLTVYDVATGEAISRTIDRAQIGHPLWSDDGETLYFNQLAVAREDAAPTERYLNSSAVAWDLISEPVALLGGSAGDSSIPVRPDQLSIVGMVPGAPRALALVINGVQNEIEFWHAPNAASPKIDTNWQRVFSFDDGITNYAIRGEKIYLLSHNDAPTFQVLSLEAGQPLSSASMVMPASKERVIESIAAAADGLYVAAREGLYSRLYRIDDEGRRTEIAVPKGTVGALFTDPREAGVFFTFHSWTVPPRQLAYDPVSGSINELSIGVTPMNYSLGAFETSEVWGEAKDGVRVPLSVVTPAGNSGPKPMLITAYGSYGVSTYPGFSSRLLSAVLEGFTVGTCHVRGGGEFGEEWRLGGKDANKPNTWRDLIACAEEAVSQGLTTPAQLFITGGSAGGIPMGMAPIERPDLFAGVIDQVPMASALRAQFQANGPANIVEFGTIDTEEGFRNLLAMDGYQNLKRGQRYPAYLITTGLNDPRVDAWQPGKLAAKMAAYNPDNVVLLRVDEDGGHGVGSTKTQTDALYADMIAFMHWQLGEDGWVR